MRAYVVSRGELNGDGVLVDTLHELAWREALKDLLEGEWSGVRDRTTWTRERFPAAVYSR